MAEEFARGPVSDFTVVHDGEQYVVRAVGDQLRIGRPTTRGLAWLDVAVPVTELGGEARRALRTGDLTCPALLIGLRFIVSAALTPESRLHDRRRAHR